MMKKTRSSKEDGTVMLEFAMVSISMIPLLFGAVLLLLVGVKTLLFNGSCMRIDEKMGKWEVNKPIEDQVRQAILDGGLGSVFGKYDELTVKIDQYDDGRNNTRSKTTDIPYTVTNGDTGEEEAWIYEIEEKRRKEMLSGTVQYDIDVNFIFARKKVHLKRKLDIENLREVEIQEHCIKDENEN